MNRVVAFVRSLVGVKGKDGTTISSVSNPVPVEGSISISTPDAYKVANLALDSAKTNEAVIGSTKFIRWIMVHYYDGANSALAPFDQVIKIGTTGGDGIPMWTLTRPDTPVWWEGRIEGDVFVTTTAQAGKRLILIVGYEV